MSEGGVEREKTPDECELCRLVGYRGDTISEPEGMVIVAREDGGTKIVHCCEGCSDEVFSAPVFCEYDWSVEPENQQEADR
jgi:hypothetical protein